MKLQYCDRSSTRALLRCFFATATAVVYLLSLSCCCCVSCCLSESCFGPGLSVVHRNILCYHDNDCLPLHHDNRHITMATIYNLKIHTMIEITQKHKHSNRYNKNSRYFDPNLSPFFASFFSMRTVPLLASLASLMALDSSVCTKTCEAIHEPHAH
jgi:hypothetical protein